MEHDLSRTTRIEDLHLVVKRKMPRVSYDYINSGSWMETTYRENTSNFKDIRLHRRVLVNMEGRSLEIRMIDQDIKMPVAIAPTGFTDIAHADGEILAVRVAEKLGTPFTLSVMSICSIEDVTRNTSVPFWFQLYMIRNRKFMENLTKRVKDVKCSVLVLTADLQVLGRCCKGIKNGLSAPSEPTTVNLINLTVKPEWCMKMLNTERHTFYNIVGHTENVGDLSSLSLWISEQFDPRLNWDDVARIKNLWGDKLTIKGIMELEDVERAVKNGVNTLAVSNHGGCQLDDTVSSIKVLPDIVSVVGSGTEVWMDSGIHGGQGILEAWTLGIKGMMIGHAFLYGLGTCGEEGVTRALEILYREMDISMAFTGHRSIQDVDADILQSMCWSEGMF